MSTTVRIGRPAGGPVHSGRARLLAEIRLLGSRLRRSAFLAPAGLTLYLAVKGLHPGLPGWTCPLRALTGFPCPTCFLTRATASALTGHIRESIQWHAFGPPAAVVLVLWSLLAIRRRRLLPMTIPARRGVVAGAVTVLSLLIHWLARLVLQFGFGVQAFPVSL